jgi:Cytochrome P450
VARIKPLFGEGLTTSKGALWQSQRHLMQPLFQGRRLPWADVIAEATTAMLTRWEPFAMDGHPIDLWAVLRDVTREIMHQILFGSEAGPDALAAGQALTQAMGQLDRHLWAMLPPPLWLPTRHIRHIRRARCRLDVYVHRRIAECRRPRSASDGLLTTLRAVRDDTTGEPMSATQLRDEAVTLWAAGHTTVAEALVWSWSLLAQYPEAEHALQGNSPPSWTVARDRRRPPPPPLYVSGHRRSSAPLPADLGDGTHAAGRPGARRPPDLGRIGAPPEPLRAAASPGLLGTPRALRPRTVYAGARRRPTPLHLLSLRRRPAAVHRAEPRDARDGSYFGYGGPGL